MTPEAPAPQTPPAQYVGAEYVLDVMGRAGVRRIRSLSAVQILVLAAIGGGFITSARCSRCCSAPASTRPGRSGCSRGSDSRRASSS